jgi:hypothetical protein
MPINPERPRTARKISFGFLLKTLDREWEGMQANPTPLP